MLAVLLTVLKTVGIIILALLAFLLLLLVLILFVPIRYEAKASYYKRPLADAGASWLFHLISFRADYEESLTWSLRVLGINIFRQKPEGESEEKESMIPLREEESPPENADLKELAEEEKKEPRQEVKKEAEEEAEEEYRAQVDFEERTENDERLEHPKTEMDKEEAEERSSDAEVLREWDKAEEFGRKMREESPLRSIRPAAHRFFRNIRDFLRRQEQFIKDRLRYLKVELWEAAIEKKDWLVWLLRDPANVATYHLLWKQLKKLLNHIKPRKLEGDVKFGFDDPYTTGMILTAISPFYPIYGEHITVTPVFDESVTEGKISLKGRVRAAVIIEVVVRMLLDKNFRYLLNKFLNPQG